MSIIAGTEALEFAGQARPQRPAAALLGPGKSTTAWTALPDAPHL